MAAFDDADANVRYNAAGTLGDLRASLAVERLKKALQDPDAEVRANVADALEKINSGKGVAVSPSKARPA
jgi:HEAT repeat protein